MYMFLLFTKFNNTMMTFLNTLIIFYILEANIMIKFNEINLDIYI